MGAYLSDPKTDKSSSEEENEFLKFGASSMQGWRINQEVFIHLCGFICLKYDFLLR